MVMRVTTTHLTKQDLLDIIESQFAEYTSWDTIAVVSTIGTLDDNGSNTVQSVTFAKTLEM